MEQKKMEDLDLALARWRRRFPEITEDEALADLFALGYECEKTYRANQRRMAAAEDKDHNVIEHPDEFLGMHLAAIKPWKPGVIRYTATRRGREIIIGYARLDVLRVAIETGVVRKPNGYMLP